MTIRMVRLQIKRLFGKKRKERFKENLMNSTRSNQRRLIAENKLLLTKPKAFSMVSQLKAKSQPKRVLLRRSERPRRLPIRPTLLLPKPRRHLLLTRMKKMLDNSSKLSEPLKTEPTSSSRKCKRCKSTSISSRLSSWDSNNREMRYSLVDWKKNSKRLKVNLEDSKMLSTKPRRPSKSGKLKRPDLRKLRVKLTLVMTKQPRRKPNKILKPIMVKNKVSLMHLKMLRKISMIRKNSSMMLPPKERDCTTRRRDKTERLPSPILMDKSRTKKLKLLILRLSMTTGCK